MTNRRLQSPWDAVQLRGGQQSLGCELQQAQGIPTRKEGEGKGNGFREEASSLCRRHPPGATCSLSGVTECRSRTCRRTWESYFESKYELERTVGPIFLSGNELGARASLVWTLESQEMLLDRAEGQRKQRPWRRGSGRKPP